MVGPDPGGGVALRGADTERAEHAGGEKAYVSVVARRDELDQLNHPSQKLDRFCVGAPCLGSLCRGHIQRNGAVGKVREVEMLSYQGRIGSGPLEFVGDAGVGLEPCFEDLGFVCGISEERMAESVANTVEQVPGRLDDAYFGELSERADDSVSVVDHGCHCRQVEAGAHGGGNLCDSQVESRRLQPTRQQLVESERERFGFPGGQRRPGQLFDEERDAFPSIDDRCPRLLRQVGGAYQLFHQRGCGLTRKVVEGDVEDPVAPTRVPPGRGWSSPAAGRLAPA